MAGMGETEKQKNVEGKMAFLLADVARKLGLAYPTSLHLQEIFHICEQGWNGQGKGSDATESKLSATHTWCNMWHDPLCLTCSSHKTKQVSFPAATEAVPPCLTNDMNWFSGAEETKAVDLEGVYSLLSGMSFPPRWSHPNGRRVVSLLSQKLCGPQVSVILCHTSVDSSTSYSISCYHLRQLLTISYQRWVLNTTGFNTSLKFQYSKLHRLLSTHL